MYQYILFDLDGTITDSQEGITKAVAHALAYYGIAVTDLHTLRPFIGPPLRESFRNFYGFSPEQAEEAVAKYREYYSVKGLLENTVYEGVEALLAQLKAEGRFIALATSKPEVYAKKILEHFGLMKYFDFVAGSELNGVRDKKTEVIEYVLASIPAQDKSQIVMIGDRKHDINGANDVGIDSVGVLYGFGDEAELKEAGATYIAGTAMDIKKFV